ncbi:isoleucyl-tRNA synthetase, variant, partial [Sphaeroforma arctica JP610]
DRCVHGLYEWQQKNNTGAEFILHDGPPYANGPLHLGHALNKITKDIVNRYKLMTNHRVTYVPGWDCHGLPIELKAMEAKKKSNKKAKISTDTSPIAIRETARDLAANTIVNQMAGFVRWGVLGDWQRPYRTMTSDYVDTQLGLFYAMYEKGYVYRAYKPVYWSPSSRTALAEAELEYVDDHVSPSIYVKFPLVRTPKALHDKDMAGHGAASLLVWTTTPWTMPANRAVCVRRDMQYSLLKWDNEACWVAASRVEAMVDVLGIREKDFKVNGTCLGTDLEGAKYRHPIHSDMECPVLLGDHVTDDSGSGLVHTAPAHGVDDFAVCGANGIHLGDDEDVDWAGRFTANAGPDLEGKDIHKQGTDDIISKLSNDGLLLSHVPYKHRYPYDWRTKKPVIQRATKQWFGRVHSGLGDLALELLKGVTFVPSMGRSRLSAMVSGRRDWCLSRQRVWGVPIPVFYNGTTGDEIMDENIVRHVRALIREHGSDCWFTMTVDDLLPEAFRGQGLVKGHDTMDVWFDSGSSWASVVNPESGPQVADLYLEGSDQHRGWFQSSLLISAAVQNASPYKAVLTHGFVLDEKSKKMSKSLGNVIAPEVVVEGGQVQGQKIPAGGADALRMWVSSADSTGDVSVGASVLKQSLGQLMKIRNTARFLLGNLADFHGNRDAVPYAEMLDIDKYMLHRCVFFANEVTSHYDAYALHRVTQATMKFVNLELSAFYFDVIKDRLYTDRETGARRRSAQTALYHTLNTLTRAIAPILPHLADEVWHHNISSPSHQHSIFKSGWLACEANWKSADLQSRWDIVKKLTSHVNRSLESMRKESLIGGALDAEVTITGPPELISLLQTCSDGHPIGAASYLSGLNDAFLVSSTTLLEGEVAESSTPQETPQTRVTTVDLADIHPSLTGRCVVTVSAAQVSPPTDEEKTHTSENAQKLSKCKRCWKVAARDSADVCVRCSDVLNKQWWCPR